MERSKGFDNKIYRMLREYDIVTQGYVKDGSYYTFFVSEAELPRTMEAISILKRFGMEKVNVEPCCDDIHFYKIGLDKIEENGN